MKCAECGKDASYIVEVKNDGIYGGRSTVQKCLCKKCYYNNLGEQWFGVQEKKVK